MRLRHDDERAMSGDLERALDEARANRQADSLAAQQLFFVDAETRMKQRETLLGSQWRGALPAAGSGAHVAPSARSASRVRLWCIV